MNTPSLNNNNSFNVHSSVSDIVTKEVSITLHYIHNPVTPLTMTLTEPSTNALVPGWICGETRGGQQIIFLTKLEVIIN